MSGPARDAAPRQPAHPDPYTSITLTSLHCTRGANFWSTSPVTRLDLRVGAYDDISSADVPGFTELLVAAMPGLEAHRCSIGERGGFIVRLRRGTYAAHIIEHIALELQTMIGHEVGFGRTRGGDVEGEYTLVFEHRHEAVGLRAAALALEAVQQAFAGTLETVSHAVAELESLARLPDVPQLRQRIRCGITGGDDRQETRELLARRGVGVAEDGETNVTEDDLVVDVAPSYILQQGLPYSRSSIAVILDAEPRDVPERYRDPARARQLVGTVIDAVPRGGVVIVGAKEWELQEQARDARCRVAVFAPDEDITMRDRKLARASAWVANGRIQIEWRGNPSDGGPLAPGISPRAQVAAALAARTLNELETADAADAAYAEQRAAAAQAAAAASRAAAAEPRQDDAVTRQPGESSAPVRTASLLAPRSE